jgi:LPPG:FO 2-phospho-L-lactate transferase
MADAPVCTMIETTTEGALPFQQWFVRRRAEPRVRAVRFEGTRAPAAGLLAAIAACDFVVVGPSNPYVSVDPITTLDGVRDALARKPMVAVSPIVGGAAIKGPLATMIPDLTGAPPSAGAIARHYGSLLHGLVVERGDEGTVPPGLPVLGAATVMKSRDDRLRLAREVLAFASELAHPGGAGGAARVGEAGG